MSEKIFSEQEIEEYANLGYNASLETHRGYNGREIVRQQQATIRELREKVSEAEEIERLLKECLVEKSHSTDCVYYDDKQGWTMQGFTDVFSPSLLSALRSLELQKYGEHP